MDDALPVSRIACCGEDWRCAQRIDEDHRSSNEDIGLISCLVDACVRLTMYAKEDDAMNVVRYKTPGGIGNLSIGETDDPGLPGPNELRVKIHGSSLNGHDQNVAKGILP